MRDNMPPENRNTTPAKYEINVGSFAGAGIQFAVAVVLFVLLGQWLDRKLGTAPIFLLAGVFVGGTGAFYSMYRRLTAAQKADDERRKREKDSIK
jgi:F0F1-type ATP synthase assembly protein I